MQIARQLGCALTLALVGCGSSPANESGEPEDVPSSTGSGGSGSMPVVVGGSSGTSTNTAGSPGSSAGGSTTTGAGGGGTGGTGTSAGGASGGGGSAGAGGAGGSLPHTVGACDALGKVNTWENVSPPGIVGKQYGGGAVLVNPQDTRVVYLGSGDGGGLFKSTNCGATWVHINTGKNGSELDRGRMWSMVIDPVDPNILYSVNGYGALSFWKSTNGGVDWTDLFPPTSEVAKTADYNFASIASMDPTDHLHLVMAFHGGCKGAYAPQCQAFTKDGGATWKLVKTPVAGEGVGVIVIGPTTWVSGGYEGFFRTGDDGATWTKVSTQQSCHYLMQIDKNGKYYVGCGGGVITSSGDGSTWTLIPKSGDHLQGIASDGKTIFASQQFAPGKYFSAPESDPTHWAEVPNNGGKWGAYYMAGDPDHHIIYGSEMGDGLWRMVTY